MEGRDSLRRALCAALVLAWGVVLAAPGEGSLRRIAIDSRFVGAREVVVWLPDDYDSTRRYPVLYLNDGQNLFDTLATRNGQEWRVDETLSRLIASDSLAPLLVVAIPHAGERRRADYFPQVVVAQIPEPRRGELLALLRGGPRADAYLKFVVREVKPRIDSLFATRRDAAATFIGGASSGALSALYAICEYPEVFSGAACLSTHWTGIPRPNADIPAALLSYLTVKLPSPASHRFYFDHGGRGLDANYAPHQRAVDALLRARGYDARHLLSLADSTWDHDEASWATRFPVAVKFLLGE